MKRTGKFLATVAAMVVSLAAVTAAYAGTSSKDNDPKDVTKSFDITDVSKVVVKIPADVEYEQGKVFCKITGTEKALEAVSLSTREGVLTIDSTNKLFNFKRIKIKLGTATPLEVIKILGAGNFICEDGYDVENLTINLNGAGKVEMNDIDAEDIDITLNGAGKVTMKKLECDDDLKAVINGAGSLVLKGSAESAELTLNGAGSIDITSFECENLETALNGAGKIKK